MDALLDKAYVMAQLRRSSEFGLFKEAVSIVAGEKRAPANVNWHQIRLELDQILPGITEPRWAIRNTQGFGAYRETGGYPAYLGRVAIKRRVQRCNTPETLKS